MPTRLVITTIAISLTTTPITDTERVTVTDTPPETEVSSTSSDLLMTSTERNHSIATASVATTADTVPQHVAQVDTAPQLVDTVLHLVDTVLPLPATTVASATSDTDPQADTVPPLELATVATAHTVNTRDPNHPTLTELTKDTAPLRTRRFQDPQMVTE